jgi:hypothetical protein
MTMTASPGQVTFAPWHRRVLDGVLALAWAPCCVACDRLARRTSDPRSRLRRLLASPAEADAVAVSTLRRTAGRFVTGERELRNRLP